MEQIVKEHYTTNRYAGFRFYMSDALAFHTMRRYQPQASTDDIAKLLGLTIGQPLLRYLMGIPIIIDVSMGSNDLLWMLIDPTGEEVERGQVWREDVCCNGAHGMHHG
jgi:hypothetical protein